MCIKCVCVSNENGIMKTERIIKLKQVAKVNKKCIEKRNIMRKQISNMLDEE